MKKNKYEIINKLLDENNGAITSKILKENNIDKRYIYNLIEEKKLIKLDRGYYGRLDYIEDEYYKISLKSNKAIFSLYTSLYFHNLITKTPLYFYISLPNSYNGSLNKQKSIKVSYVNKDAYGLGKIEVLSPYGNKIKIYDLERTICDIIKYKNKIDDETFATSLKEYVKRKDKDLNKLYKYAKVLKIENKLNTYMEVLL